MEKVYHIENKGDIHYWIHSPEEYTQTLVFLPGLTVDHRLFDAQIEFFSKKYRTLVWDAPAHNKSRPWSLDFSLMDMADYLHDILQKENIEKPVIIGQSLGGFIAQSYIEKYELSGFVSVDSGSLKRKYMSDIDIWLLKRTKPMFKCFSWRALINSCVKVCAVTEKAKELMRTMMNEYSKDEYIELSSFGFKILAEAIEANLPYEINCPTILICGTKDKASLTKSYNKTWAKKEGLELHWIENAGHNSNTDCPDEVNAIINNFLKGI